MPSILTPHLPALPALPAWAALPALPAVTTPAAGLALTADRVGGRR